MFANQYLVFTIALVLAIFGALNLGFVAWTSNNDCEGDLVHDIVPAGWRGWVYGAVGIAGLVLAFLVLSRNIFGQRSGIMKVPGDLYKGAVKVVKRK